MSKLYYTQSSRHDGQVEIRCQACHELVTELPVSLPDWEYYGRIYRAIGEHLAHDMEAYCLTNYQGTPCALQD